MNDLVPMKAAELSVHGMSPAMQIMLDDRLFERAKQIATYMSKAEGFLPKHLIGRAESCFAVVTRALTWKLDPFAVAACTYQVAPGANIGYEGKLCQAILENSGAIVGRVEYEHVGDWSKIQAKFRIQENAKGFKYPVPAWKDEDEEGLAVIVSAQVKGEENRRTHKFWLRQAFPRNSTLWALDPMTQICYTAVRRFASVAAPGVFMGIPFDYEPDETQMRDVTPPRPQRVDFEVATTAQPEPAEDKPKDDPKPDDTANAGASPPSAAAEPARAEEAAKPGAAPAAGPAAEEDPLDQIRAGLKECRKVDDVDNFQRDMQEFMDTKLSKLQRGIANGLFAEKRREIIRGK